MKGRPTRTTNRLHFTDLDPTRFEDLCLALVYPLHPWVEIQHYGRLGSDGGVDIAQEQLDDESVRRWYVQCRRYSRATKASLEKAVDDALAKAPEVPQVLVVVVACDIRRDAHEEYKKYALGKGVSTPMLWTASLLEARLYAERNDLLFSYFGISAAKKARSEEVSIRRNLVIKRRVAKDLIRKNLSFEDIEGRPWGKFEYSEAIIHSVDDDSYPKVDQQSVGISGWFKVEFCDLYHNSIEFLMRIQTAMEDPQGRWAIVPNGESIDKVRFTEFRVYLVGRLPYRNIVEIATTGDEYYPGAHLYCRFADRSEPWENFVYRYVTEPKEYPQHVDADSQIDFKELVDGKRITPRSTGRKPRKRGSAD